MAEYGREIPERWRESWTYWFQSLGLTWEELQEMGGPDRKLAKNIAEGRKNTALTRTLRRMTEALGIDLITQAELLELIGIRGVQRRLPTFEVRWRGVSGSFGYHADEALDRAGLKTPEQFQTATNIGLPWIESLGAAVVRLGPDNAATLLS